MTARSGLPFIPAQPWRRAGAPGRQVVSAGETDIFMALGWGGQFVICVPALDLVVATNAYWQVDADSADAQERAILAVIVEGLFPLIPVRSRPPRRPSGRIGPLSGSSAEELSTLGMPIRSVPGRDQPEDLQ